MKKLVKLFSIVTTAAAGAFALVNVSNRSNNKVESAEAAGYKYSAGTIIYLDPSSFNPSNPWTGGYLGAWCHYNASNSSNNDMWEEFWFDDLSGKYMFKLSHECASFTMARYGGSSRQDKTSWGEDVWNSADFTFESGKNYLYATGWFTGEWQTLTYHVAGTFSNPQWAGADSAYKMNDGFNDENHHEASFTLTTTKENEEIKCTTNYNGTVPGDNWYGTLVDGYNTNYIGTKSGNIVLKKAATYEIYLNTSRKVWVQISSADEADHYAEEFLSVITCTSDSKTFADNAWNEVEPATTSMEYKFKQLTHGAQNVLKGATGSTSPSASNVEKCIARYDRILGKYGYGTESGQLHDFMGRNPTLFSNSRFGLSINTEKTTSVLIISIISLVAVSAIGGYFFYKKRRVNI